MDANAFAARDPRVDFDVNNLKLERSAGDAVQLKVKRPEQQNTGTVDSIVNNISQGRLVVLKSIAEVPQRVAKMQARGWVVQQPL